MMFDKLKNRFTKLSIHPKGDRYHLGKNPAADWLIILAGFIVCVLFIGALSLTVYESGVDEGDGSSSTASSTPELISSSTIHRVIDYYEARRAAIEARTSTSTPVDPSQ